MNMSCDTASQVCIGSLSLELIYLMTVVARNLTSAVITEMLASQISGRTLYILWAANGLLAAT